MTSSGVSEIEYPFPLRERGPIVRLILPRDLTMAEVQRLEAFMRTLVVDDGG